MYRLVSIFGVLQAQENQFAAVLKSTGITLRRQKEVCKFVRHTTARFPEIVLWVKDAAVKLNAKNEEALANEYNFAQLHSIIQQLREELETVCNRLIDQQVRLLLSSNIH